MINEVLGTLVKFVGRQAKWDFSPFLNLKVLMIWSRIKVQFPMMMMLANITEGTLWAKSFPTTWGVLTHLIFTIIPGSLNQLAGY